MSPFAGLAVIPSGCCTPSGSTAKVLTSRSMNNRLPSANAWPAVMPIEKNSGIPRTARFFFISPPRVWMASKKMNTTFPSANTLRGPGIPPRRPLRRDRDSANRVPGDRLCDEPRSLHVLGELTEIFRAGRPSLGRAHRLLHGGKAALQHARPRKLRRVGSKARLEPGEHFEFILHENIVRTLDPLDAYERGVPEGAAQVQVIGAVHRHGDADTLPVHFAHRANRRAGRDEVARLGLEVGGAESDLARALGLVAEEGDVPRAGLHRIGQLSRGLEGDEINGNVQPPAELPPQIDRDATILPARRILVHQEEISVVDSDAELPRRGQLGSCGGRRRHGVEDSMSQATFSTKPAPLAPLKPRAPRVFLSPWRRIRRLLRPRRIREGTSRRRDVPAECRSIAARPRNALRARASQGAFPRPSRAGA